MTTHHAGNALTATMALPNGHEASADSGHLIDHPAPSGALPPDRTPPRPPWAAHEDGDNDEQRADGNEPEAVPLQTGA
jgi:hypothetical protein